MREALEYAYDTTWASTFPTLNRPALAMLRTACRTAAVHSRMSSTVKFPTQRQTGVVLAKSAAVRDALMYIRLVHQSRTIECLRKELTAPGLDGNGRPSHECVEALRLSWSYLRARILTGRCFLHQGLRSIFLPRTPLRRGDIHHGYDVQHPKCPPCRGGRPSNVRKPNINFLKGVIRVWNDRL